MIRRPVKERMHPRNRFRKGYDFPALIAVSPPLGAFVAANAHGDASIDYSKPDAVRALNQALLKVAYGVDTWGVPPGYLCPPVPGRSDYVHQIADLLDRSAHTRTSRRDSVLVLDIGMGASCIYPLVGASEYGWRFVGSEIDPVALRWAKRLAAASPVSRLIECRLQKSPSACFAGVVKPGEIFDVSMCNPPFHASAAEAAASSGRKRRNLGSTKARMTVLNFGGQPAELWCDGGELGFLQRMIAESAGVPGVCRWFTTLVSKSTHLPRLYQSLRAVNAADVQTLDMAQGQKRSRVLAWTFDRSRSQVTARAR